MDLSNNLPKTSTQQVPNPLQPVQESTKTPEEGSLSRPDKPFSPNASRLNSGLGESFHDESSYEDNELSLNSQKSQDSQKSEINPFKGENNTLKIPTKRDDDTVKIPTKRDNNTVNESKLGDKEPLLTSQNNSVNSYQYSLQTEASSKLTSKLTGMDCQTKACAVVCSCCVLIVLAVVVLTALGHLDIIEGNDGGGSHHFANDTNGTNSTFEPYFL